jgi:hypothetical protein
MRGWQVRVLYGPLNAGLSQTLGAQMKDRQREILYIGCGAVIIVSFAAAYVLPLGNILKGTVMAVGLGSVVFVLWRLWRGRYMSDQIAELQIKEPAPAVGVASPITGGAYDKHAAFCEEYMRKVQQGFSGLTHVGPVEEFMNIGDELAAVRLRHAPYLTSEIRSKLEAFEAALIKIKANKDMAFDILAGEEKGKGIKEVYKFFALVMGGEKPISDVETNMLKDEIVGHIRNILGMSILAALKQKSFEPVFKR